MYLHLCFLAQASSCLSNGFVPFCHWGLLVLRLSHGGDGGFLLALGVSPELCELEEERCVRQGLNPTVILFSD